MPKVSKLTQRSVETLSCPPGRKDVLVFDGELRGFGVRVTASGAKIFLAHNPAVPENAGSSLGGLVP